MSEIIIVSRHPAAIAFIRREMPEAGDAPVLAVATADDVRGRRVVGNLPMHLAALAAEVVAVEFDGDPPRGQEYDLAAMDAAGARLVSYRVRPSAFLRALGARLSDSAVWGGSEAFTASSIARAVAELR